MLVLDSRNRLVAMPCGRGAGSADRDEDLSLACVPCVSNVKGHWLRFVIFIHRVSAPSMVDPWVSMLQLCAHKRDINIMSSICSQSHGVADFLSPGGTGTPCSSLNSLLPSLPSSLYATPLSRVCPIP